MQHKLLDHLEKDEFKLIRRRFIDSILATDMATHFKQLGNLKAKIELFDIENGKNIDKFRTDDVNKKYENQQAILNLCIHAADVSNPAKPFVVYKKWVDLVFQEFFTQGDTEKKSGLQVTLLCDRETTSISKSQVGFINFVVKPTFDLLAKFIPEVKPYQDNIDLNLTIFESKAQEEQKKKTESLKKEKEN